VIEASAELLGMPPCITLAHVTRLPVAQAFLRRPVIVLLIFVVFRQLQPQHDERESILLGVNLFVQGWRATSTLDVYPEIVRLISEIVTDHQQWPLRDFLAEEHEAQCAASCYMCVQQYQNRRYHPLLDWRLGLAYLRAIQNSDFRCGLDGRFDQFPELRAWRQKAQALAQSVASMRPRSWRADSVGVQNLPCLTEVDRTGSALRRLVVVHPLWRTDSN
jgi:hypothetical protein